MAIINGTVANDTLLGTAADDVINGLAGADTMSGGLGNDTYIVDNIGDVVIENAGQGIDTVQSSVTYTLGANIENLTLTGAAAINATGNALDNILTGNSAINTLKGGLGNDTYIVQNTGDIVVENAGEGTDTINSSASYTLSANVENLTLTGTVAITGTGNALDNILTSNSVQGGFVGSSVLIGGLGNDTYYAVGDGTTVIENAGGGIDTVISNSNFTLGANIENLTLISPGSTGTGNDLDNILRDTGTSNVVWTSVLAGGLGNDTYYVRSNVETHVIENVGGGIDTVMVSHQSYYGYALDANIENLIADVSTAQTMIGNNIDNVITIIDTTGKNDTVDGGAGADTMSAGYGDDTYIVDNTNDAVFEIAGQGTDNVQSTAVNYTLNDNVENLTLTGSAAINGAGNNLDNVIVGNTANNILSGGLGNDTLNGLAGTDTLIGGSGDDTYIVDNAGDVIIENAGEGIDTVQSSAANYTLAANVENITLLAAGYISVTGQLNPHSNATGNELNNSLIGNDGNNVLDGGVGNDTIFGGMGGDTLIGGLGNDWLDGGTGADTMKGGAGEDTYVVDQIGDIVSENAGEGIDTIQSSVSRVLGANVENLILTGTTNTFGTGNTLDNMLTGNIGNNTLDGGVGADTMAGGAGNDIYMVDNIGDVVIENVGEGIDTIQTALNYALTDTSVENLWLTGTAAINATGNALDNTLRGDLNTAANVLAGGLGNDTYNIDGTDIVIENAGGGIDTVIIADWAVQSYTLGANLENLTMGNGSAAPTRTAVGNELDNIINLINKNGSNDVIDGGAGADTMSAGFADDTYYVDNVGDVVIENVGEGYDTIFSTVSYNMANALNVENIALVGTNLVATGTALNNTYTINDASNIVIEAVGGGTDTIITSLGSYTLGDTIENLTMTGEDAVSGNATIGTGNALDNTINAISSYFFRPASVLSGGLGNDKYVADVWDTIVENAGEGVDTVYLNPIAFWAMGTVLDYTIAANVENLSFDTYLINGFSYAANVIGNAENNVITIECSSSYADVINGGLGADTMSGGYGNDTYYVDNAGDIVIEGSIPSLYASPGIDTIISSISYSLVDSDGAGTDGGNVENLTLSGVDNLNATGNVLDNILTGNAGNNILVGGLGNDTYVIQNAGDLVIENAGEGVDTVQSSVTYTLAANLENLTLTGVDAISGTGNELDNVLHGNTNTAANVLAGGVGNDTYYIDGVDTVIENTGEGIDTIVIGEAAGFTSYTLGANLENLTIQAPRFTPQILVSGNELNNVLVVTGGSFNGRYSNDILDGGAGADTMNGDYGSDTYIVDNVGDVVIETDATYLGGIDTVKSSVSYTLATNVENMILTGTDAINATGNGLNNVLAGNGANNLLTGGLGSDTFVFNTTLDASNIDNITDFVHGSDHIQLALTQFGGAGAAGVLSASAFASGAGMTAATTVDQHIIYNSTSGALYYDADGVGGAASIAFATLLGTPAVTSADFMLA